MLKDIINSEPPILLVYFILIFSALCPGVLVIYYFNPSLLLSIDIFKVILFTVALFLPFLVINFFVGFFGFFSLLSKNPSYKLKPINMAFIPCLYSMFIMYFSLIICYLFNLSFKGFLLCSFICEFIISVDLLVRILRNRSFFKSIVDYYNSSDT